VIVLLTQRDALKPIAPVLQPVRCVAVRLVMRIRQSARM
jgi:hypothetical protein